MVNLTEMWVAAGRPAGRGPSNWKATSAMKRRLAEDPGAWLVEGRGAKSATWASEVISEGYAEYLKTPVGKRGPRTTSSSPTSGGGTYTVEEMAKAFQAGRREGHAIGYEDGFQAGRRMGGFNVKMEELRAYLNSHEHGRKGFAKRFHPDVKQASGYSEVENMQFINNFFDKVESIFSTTSSSRVVA